MRATWWCTAPTRARSRAGLACTRRRACRVSASTTSDRGPPHHVPRAVPPHRRAAPRLQDHAVHAVRALLLHGHEPTGGVAHERERGDRGSGLPAARAVGVHAAVSAEKRLLVYARLKRIVPIGAAAKLPGGAHPQPIEALPVHRPAPRPLPAVLEPLNRRILPRSPLSTARGSPASTSPTHVTVTSPHSRTARCDLLALGRRRHEAEPSSSPAAAAMCAGCSPSASHTSRTPGVSGRRSRSMRSVTPLLLARSPRRRKAVRQVDHRVGARGASA